MISCVYRYYTKVSHLVLQLCTYWCLKTQQIAPLRLSAASLPQLSRATYNGWSFLKSSTFKGGKHQCSVEKGTRKKDVSSDFPGLRTWPQFCGLPDGLFKTLDHSATHILSSYHSDGGNTEPVNVFPTCWPPSFDGYKAKATQLQDCWNNVRGTWVLHIIWQQEL